jgi:hypothetical protein
MDEHLLSPYRAMGSKSSPVVEAWLSELDLQQGELETAQSDTSSGY